QAFVHLRSLVGTAADQHDAARAQPGLYRRPVDLAGLYLLVHPHLHPTGARVIWASDLRRVEHAVTASVAAGPPLAAPDAARGLGATHDAAGAMDRRVQRLLGLAGIHALEDH